MELHEYTLVDLTHTLSSKIAQWGDACGLNIIYL